MSQFADDDRRDASRAPGTLFVGRERELSELSGSLRGAIDGRGALRVLTGDPGIGKTRLAEEFSRRAASAGVLVVWGRCWEFGGAPEFWPWVQVVRGLAREVGAGAVAKRLGGAAPRFARLAPELRRSAEPATSAAEAEGDRFALFSGVSSLLREVSSGRALLLVLDDLHAADRSSLLLLGHLAVELRDMRVFVLGTYRETEVRSRDDVADLLDRIERDGRPMRLEGLDEADVRQIVERGIGRSAPEQLVAALHRMTDGNPLFLDEAVRLVDAEASTLVPPEVPPRVRDTIRRRLEVLDPGTRELLTVAGAIGQEFDSPLLRAAGAVEEDELRRGLAEAEAAEIVRRRHPERWSFAHGLFREVLLSDLPAVERARIHAAVGEAIERSHARGAVPPVAQLAYHFTLASDVVGAERAVTYSVHAGERAARAFAYDEAVAHFERALEMLGDDDPERRWTCLVALGRARAGAGHLPGAADDLKRAVELARELSEPHRIAEAALALGELSLGATWTRPWAADDRLVSILREAVEALGGEGSILAARTTALLAASLQFSDRRDEGERLSEQALDLARRLDDPATIAYCLGARHLAAWGPDNLEDRLAIATELVRLAGEVGNTDLLLQARVWRMADLLEAGRIAEADEELEAYARAAEATHRRHLHGYVAFLRAQRAVFDGRLDEADRLADDAYRVAEEVGDENVLGSYWCLILPMRRWQGRLDEVETGYREAYRRYAPNVGWRLALAWICSQVGTEEETRRLLEGVVEAGAVHVPRDAYHLGMLPFLAEACARLADRERAAVVLDAYRPFAGRHVIAGRDGVCLWGSAGRPLGTLANVSGQADDAIALLEDAIDANRRMGSRPWVAETQLELAGALLGRDRPGDRERAEAVAAEAIEVARQLEMAGLEARAVELTGDVTSRASDGPHVFRREGEYWTLAFRGKSVRVRDAKGLHDLAFLLASPGKELHVADLIAATDGPPERRAATPELATAGANPEPVLDAAARSAYRARLVELQDDIAEAERNNDPERAALAKEEMDFIAAELASALGLGGRPRRTADPAERARKAVAQRIRNAIGRIERLHPELGAHLGRSIRTGRFCSYVPERPTTWTT